MKKITKLLIILIIIFPVNLFGESRLNIKIGPSNEANKVINISSDSNFTINSSDFTEITKTNQKDLSINFTKDKIFLSGKNFKMENFPSDGSLLINSDKPIKVDNLKRSYLGALSFRINNGKLDIINNIDMENYLRGILPKEMSPSFPKEALKAQAVTSRSFALSNINKFIKKGYNLDDTTSCQVYRGSSCYDKRTDEAIKCTKDQVLTYKGKIAETIFGASSGGYIADASEVWGGDSLDYLKAKEDPYSTYQWDTLISDNELSKFELGKIYNIEIKEFDNSGRAKKIIVTGQNGLKEFTGNQFRNKLGSMKIKSTLFEIINLGDSFSFKGKGFGHGVGLSQYGASAMAKNNFNYKEILNFYFPGTELENLDGLNENK